MSDLLHSFPALFLTAATGEADAQTPPEGTTNALPPDAPLEKVTEPETLEEEMPEAEAPTEEIPKEVPPEQAPPVSQTPPQTGADNIDDQVEQTAEEDEEEDQTTEIVVVPAEKESVSYPWNLFTSHYDHIALWLALAGVLVGGLIATGLVTLFHNLGNKRKKKLQPIGKIEVGKVHAQGAREYQQDCFAVSPAACIPTHGLIAVVADGMGGLENGDKVSQQVVTSILNDFLQAPSAAPAPLMWELLQRANASVNDLLGQDKLGSSGSTLVTGMIREDQFHWLSVGDSRISLLRNGHLITLNREHDYLHDLLIRSANGKMDVQDAYNDPQAGGLTSYLGQGKLSLVDAPVEPLKVFPGDVLLLMSDGVYNALSETELLACLTGSAENMAKALGDAIEAKNHARQDNYTAVILKLDAAGKERKPHADGTIHKHRRPNRK